MAKRLSPDEKPFRPLEATLIRSVIAGNSGPAVQPPVEMPPAVRQAGPIEQGNAALATNPLFPPRPVPAERPAQAPARRRAEPATSTLTERMDREKRVLLTPVEERAIDRVVVNIGAELGTSLKLSHVLRCCIRLLVNAEDELIERARATGRTIRPSNGDLPAIEAFEKVVANVLQSGLRSARPLR